MKSYFKIASPIITLICLLVIFSFKSLPASKLWNEYAVLYVPVESSDKEVINALTAAEITDAVTLSGQFLPLNIAQNSLEYSIYRFNAENPDFAYILKRQAYFFDKSKSYRLYYIPVQEKSKINGVLEALSAKGIKGGADISASYPWILPVITLLLVIVLALFSRNKIIFLVSAFIPLVNLFCNPFYQMAEATCLMLLTLFFISNVWQRKGALAYLLGNHSIPVMIFISILCAFTCTLKSGGIFLLALLGTIAILFTCKTVEDFFKSRSSFVPVYIRPAKKISIFDSKVNIIMPVVTVSAFIIFGIIFLSSITSSNTQSSNKLMLPANASEETQLPQLEDYYLFTWNFKTYPYRSLNKEENKLFVEYPKFTDDNGVVRQNSLVMAYNQSFKDNAYENIDTLSYNSIEKVLKSEGKDFKGGYAVTNSYSVTLFGVIMSLICIFVLLFIYISTIIRKGMKK